MATRQKTAAITPPTRANVRHGRELLRVGVPIGLGRLVALLEAFGAPSTATVRHFNGQLIIEEPNPTLDLDGATPNHHGLGNDDGK